MGELRFRRAAISFLSAAFVDAGRSAGNSAAVDVDPRCFVLVVQTFAGFLLSALVRRFVSSYSAALLGTVAYAANPYALLVIYTRSDYAELLRLRFIRCCCSWRSGLVDFWKRMLPAKTLVQFAFLFLQCGFRMRLRAYWRVTAWRCCFLAGATQRKFQPALRGAGGLALGLGLAAFYLIPAAYEQRWVNIAGALAEGLTPADNFLLAVTPDAEHDAFNRIASYVALLMIVITFAAAFAGGATSARAEADRAFAKCDAGNASTGRRGKSDDAARDERFVDLSSEVALRAVSLARMAILSVVLRYSRPRLRRGALPHYLGLRSRWCLRLPAHI